MTGRELLKRYKDRNRLTQKALADLLGVRQGQLSDWLNGVKRPGVDLALRIKERTRIPVAAWSRSLDERAA